MKSLNIKDIFKKIFHHKRTLAPGRNPNRDWQRIIIVSFVLLIISFSLCVVLFLGVDHGTIFEPKSTTESLTPTIDKNAINKLSSFYSDREAKIKTLTASSTSAVDPSL